jgi:acyl-CoA synthetase (AMP-forming)/AMP-acid ligase II
MQITDRKKDIIKSGGEWISSVDLENVALAHPAIEQVTETRSGFIPRGRQGFVWAVPTTGVFCWLHNAWSSNNVV